MRDVVTNTSPLLYLHQLRLLELLPRLYERVVVPSAVVAELSDGARLGYDVPVPATLPWAAVEAPPGAAILPMVTALGDGERAAIALAAARKSDLLLLDDGLARRLFLRRRPRSSLFPPRMNPCARSQPVLLV